MADRRALAQRLRVLFAGELEELVRALNADLLALEASPTDAELLKSVFRAAHTLKGAARAASEPMIEKVCHAMEHVLAASRDGTLTLAPAHFARFFAVADALADAHRRLLAGESLAGGPLEGLAAPIAAGAAPEASKAASMATAAAPVEEPPTAPGAVSRRAAASDGATERSVRIAADAVDQLLASTGQLLVAKGHLAANPADIRRHADELMRLSAEGRRTTRRVTAALQKVPGTAPLQRMVHDATEQLGDLARELSAAANALSRDTGETARASDDVIQRVRRMRMRALDEAFEPLPRVVRDVALQEGKEIQVVCAGGAIEADNAVLEGLKVVVLHLVRNAADHGIERAEVRERAGKPRRGRIAVSAVLAGGRIVVTVRDDGAGINVAALRAQLERRGVPLPDDPREMARAIFDGGVSTRTEATEISGRGVGLDIVRSWTERIRGAVDVSWEAGRGTTFTVECPISLATVRTLLVSVGTQTVAVPTSHVQHLRRVGADDVRQVHGCDMLLTADGPVPMVTLAQVMAVGQAKPPSGVVPVLLLREGDRRLAVVVDALLAEQEIVLHPLSAIARTSPVLAGGTLLATGKVALVLNPTALLSAGLSATSSGVTFGPPVAGATTRRTVLVVDDSITTRTLQQSILEAAGYDVRCAVDGADGWRILQEQGADAVVSDVEMPRMDGFGLCSAIRESRRFATLPVVLVTALETADDRARGMAVGADAYIGKSSYDQAQLLGVLAQLIGGAVT